MNDFIAETEKIVVLKKNVNNPASIASIKVEALLNIVYILTPRII
jgi:hypothetical protein